MSATDKQHAALTLKGIHKSYGSSTVLQDISCDFYAGSITSIVGENGAGKSTLAKIIAGITQPDSGSLKLFHTPVAFTHPSEAIRHGVGLVHQELSVLENLSVAENILLGHETTRRGILNRKQNTMRAQTALSRLGSSLDPHTLVRNLSLAQKQHVEIARALSFEAKIIIFDEPTSSLSERETSHLLSTLLRLKESGVTILYVSHRLAEVEAISDRVIALRDGQLSGDLSKKQLSKQTITTCMIGRPISDMYGYQERKLGEILLRAKDWIPTPWHKPLSFSVRAGEIVGIAGLVGSGRSEILHGLFGIESSRSEGLTLRGTAFTPRNPREALRHGINLVPEDRKSQGILPGFTIEQTSAVLHNSTRSKLIRSVTAEHREAKKIISDFSVRCTDTTQATSTLSGGNQQKVLLGRALSTGPSLLLLDEPTRGVDIGAKKAIYEIIFKLAGSGTAILFVSSELDEVMGIADRAIVMHEGSIAGIVAREDFSEERLFSLAAHNEDIATQKRSIG